MRIWAIVMAAALAVACGDNSAKAQRGDGDQAAAANAAEPPRNLLTLAEGAVLISASANAHAALALTDGDASSGWSNGGPRFAAPYVFVFELRAPTRLGRVGVEGAGARPGGVAGASARTVSVEASSEGPTSGFVSVGRWDAAEEGESAISVDLDRDVRWLRYTIESNHAGAGWTYLNGVVAYGAQTPPADSRFAGVYEVGPRAYLELKQDGASLTGCYVEQSGHANGEVSGSVVDGVAQLAWRRTDGPVVSGVALLVVDSRGHINGVRYRDASRSPWSGPLAPEGTTTPCSTTAPANPIAEQLAETGEARIYGILFDFDQATIKSSSEPALRQLLAALQANVSMNVDIEGHTDNVGEDAYNLALSERRAQAVVEWLAQNGVAATRLNAVGKGETTPVATNDTADGRALNRRVEVRRR